MAGERTSVQPFVHLVLVLELVLELDQELKFNK